MTQEGNFPHEEHSTKRAISPDLEKILYNKIPLLDHGFIRVVDYMGNDSAIVQAARVSYGQGTKQVSQDKGLINYLMKHRHTTPFEMCEIKVHVKLPIFVARQWIRHRTANVNEHSARYSILDKEFYLPDPAHISAQSKNNKQGREQNILSTQEIKATLDILKSNSEQCYENYEKLLNLDQTGHLLDETKQGIARELARINLTLNYYTQWYWKIDLHNLLHFISLRADPHAQYEIRVYAEALLDVVKLWVPYVYESFMEYRIHAASLSRSQVEALKKMIDPAKFSEQEANLNIRELEELKRFFAKKQE
jgi:thymidylate synthase (FAD)